MEAVEIIKIAEFVDTFQLPPDVPGMEDELMRTTGYMYRMGTLCNEAERSYAVKKANCLAQLRQGDDKTETIRKALLNSFVADEKYNWAMAKNLKSSLRSIQMSLFQAIKTRRSEL